MFGLSCSDEGGDSQSWKSIEKNSAVNLFRFAVDPSSETGGE